MTKRSMTITEALAELKTLEKRIAKKREAISGYLVRQDALKDPLEKQGGSVAFITTERQAIGDLQANIVAIRSEIQRSNGDTAVAIGGVSRTVMEWLIWRREIAPGQQGQLASLRQSINNFRNQGMQKGLKMVQAGTATDVQPTDIIVNIDEKALADEAEQLETTLGTLDGLLSLKNATTTISF